MTALRAFVPAFVTALVLPLIVGCTTSEVSWDYTSPPTVVSPRGPSDREPSGKRVVVVGEFRNPSKSSVDWTDIGEGMSDALAKTLLNHGEFDVWVNHRLSSRVEEVLSGPLEQQASELAELQRQHANVRFVITGEVTDFHHTSQLPRSLRRTNSWGFGKRSEALVAMQISIVDMDVQRVVVADHVYGISNAGKGSTERLYAGVSMGSYIFWSTPLGRASKKAVERTMQRLNGLVPTSDESIRIVRVIDPRRVSLSGGAMSNLPKGSEYYVCVYDDALGTVRPVTDRHTYLPLKARIEESGRLSSTAWLLGEHPGDLDLRGAMLTQTLPPETMVADDPGRAGRR